MNKLQPPRDFSYQVQPRPFKGVRAGKSDNIPLTAGYQGPDGHLERDDSYYFPINMLGTGNLRFGDKILFYAQTDSTENGIWIVTSVFSGFVNIKRPSEGKLNTGDIVLNPSNPISSTSTSSLLSKIAELENRLATLEGKK